MADGTCPSAATAERVGRRPPPGRRGGTSGRPDRLVPAARRGVPRARADGRGARRTTHGQDGDGEGDRGVRAEGQHGLARRRQTAARHARGRRPTGDAPVSTKLITITAAGTTDRRRVRPTNEDAFAVAPPLYVVADGMGGHRGGAGGARVRGPESG